MILSKISFIRYNQVQEPYRLKNKNSSNGIAFRAKNIGSETLYNPSEDIDNQIKELLMDFKEKRLAVIHEDIAKELNLTPDMTRNRILSNPELHDLWQDIIHRKPVKRRTLTDVHPKNKPADNELIIKIKAFLENAEKTGSPITATDILPELGISRYVFQYRIKENPELQKLWNSCEHRTKTADSIEKQEILRNVLVDCLDNSEYINYHELSKRTGLSEQACTRRIMRDEELLSIWNALKSFELKKKSDVSKRLENILSFYIKRGMIMEIDKIAQQAGLDVKICKHKIDDTPKLFKLWQSGLHKRTTLPTREESDAINNKIREVLKEANRYHILMRNEDIAKKAGIKAHVCYGRLKRVPELYELWQQNNSLLSNEYEKVNLIIQKEIEDALSEKRVLSFAELSQKTALSKSLCSNRIYSNEELRRLWTDLQKMAQDKIVETIKSAILASLEKNEKITYKILEKEYGISCDVLKMRFKQYPELKELWDKADHIGRKPEISKTQIGITKFQQAIINDKKIEQMLKQAINKGEPISQKEIAKEVGMTQGACKERIRRVNYLNDLWQKVEHKKRSDSSIELNNKIKTELKNTLVKNEDIRIEELAKRVGISKLACMGRLRINKELNSLWNNIKENRDILIKQIANLKIKGASNQQIQEELGLNKPVFEELMQIFENIERRIMSHSDKDISKSEYLKWATLTKREYELAVTKLFEKMGYKAGVTRYIIDGGVDVIAAKDGERTYIECVHNLEKGVKGKEVLALQGCKYYFGADNVILAASSGLYKPAKFIADKINKNTDNKFKVMVLEDVIKMAKKYNLNIDNLSDVKNVNHKLAQEIERKRWLFKKSETVSESERNEWKNLSKHDFINRVCQIFEKRNYKISPIDDLILKNGYILEKDEEKTILQYINSTDRMIDDIRGLYGAKDVFGVKKVIAFGLDSLTYGAQDFINVVNKKFGKECIFKILSKDRIISMYKKLK